MVSRVRGDKFKLLAGEIVLGMPDGAAYFEL